MDPNALDRLARVIGSGRSRRGVLKTLSGGALAAVAAAVGLDRARAEGRLPFGAACGRDTECISGLCLSDRAHRGQKVCGCGAASECPADPNNCQSGACVAGVCGIVELCGRGEECRRGTGECCDSHARTCNGRCGVFHDNCGRYVDCGHGGLFCSDDLTTLYDCNIYHVPVVLETCALPEVCKVVLTEPVFVGCAAP